MFTITDPGVHHQPIRVFTIERNPHEVDPAKVERGNRGHASTQNALGDYLQERGIKSLSPGPGDVDFDIAWEHGGTFYVAEVKSITNPNEEKQLRLGLGQVLRYRQSLAKEKGHVVAVLVPEREPTGSGWQELCDGSG